MQKTSIQYPRSGVEEAHTSTPLSSISISEPIAKKLNQICTEQNIAVKDLVSTLLQRMLLDHHRETKDILEKFRCHPLR